MRVSSKIITSFVAVVLTVPAFAQRAETAGEVWTDRSDVTTLNLLDGPGGKTGGPGTQFTFVKENPAGTSPKFVVEDENGVKWKVKLGPEARPETAAARLMWAAGYFTDDDYYRAQIQVKDMKRLKRGRKYVSAGGLVQGARLERAHAGKELSTWSWYENRTSGTREFNGLKVMMALINNWDLKEINNSVYETGAGGKRLVVSDLGAALGRTGSILRSKGVMKDYVHSKFVKEITPEYVDFVMHDRPPFPLFLLKHRYYTERTRMERITRHIPTADARWLGDRLGRLSATQIGDCFRSAGYTPAEVEGYTRVVLERIDTLKKL